MLWQRWLKRTLDVLIVLLVAWLLLAAAYVSLGRQFVPAIADYQDELLEWTQARVGRAIALDSLEGEMQGSQPVLTLRGLQVHADTRADSPVLFELEDVTARLDVWSSLWQRRLVMDALQVDGLALELTEDAEGQWRLHGLGSLEAREDGLDDALELLFDQRRITLLNTRIDISPYQEPHWRFEQGDLTLLNGRNWSRLDARVSLPDGQQVLLQASSVGDRQSWQNMSVGFFLELPAIDWTPYLPPHVLDRAHLQQVEAGGRFWGEWGEQRLQGLQGQLIAPALQLAVEQAMPELRDLLADFHLQLGAQQRLDIENLTLRVDEQVWPQSRLQLQRNAEYGDWQLRLDALPLALVGQLVTPLLPEARHREILATLAPEGTLRQIHVTGGADLRDLDSLAFSATAERVGVQAWEGVPALHGLSATFEGKVAAGEVRSDSQQWSMHLPRLFPHSWHYARAQGAMTWQWSNEDGLRLDAPGIKVEAEEGPVAVDLGLHIPRPGGVPTMDLRVSLQNSDARYAERYLPVLAPGFSPALVTWLEAADFTGQVPLGIFQYHGSLLKGAEPEERQLSLYLEVEQGGLVFQPGWPRIEQASGVVRLDNADLDIRATGAQLLQTELSDIHVTTDRESAETPLVLSVSGHAQGPLSDALSVMQDTPLAQMTGNPLREWQGQGTLVGDLKLAIPMQGNAPPTVRIQWHAQASELRIPQLQTPLNNLVGSFHFDLQKGLHGQDLEASILGGTITGSIDQHQGQQRLQIRGQHSISELRAWPVLAQMPAGLASGKADWTGTAILAEGRQRIEVRSDLVGVALDFPGPLAKKPNSKWPSVLQLDSQGQTQNWSFNLGTDLRGRLRSRGAEVDGEVRYRHGAPGSQMGKGLTVMARFDEFDLPAWQSWLDSHPLGLSDTQELQPLRGSANNLVRAIDLRANRFVGFGQTLSGLALTGARADAGWLFDIEQARIRGQVTLPDRVDLPIQVNLQRLYFERPAESPVADALAKPLMPEDSLRTFKPSTLPPMDLHIDQLYWAGEQVGAVDMRLRPDAGGAKIDGLDVNLRGLRLTGDMDWREAGPRSHFKGQMVADNMADVLKAWDYAPTLSSKHFAMQADLSWPGSPIFFALGRSTGQLQLQAENGALHSGETSADALRIFGLLNFNAFARRLRLDFRDLFGSGTAYDTLKGDLVFSDGVMHTVTPLVMDGPGAKLQLEGKLNLVADRIDMGMLVTLPVTNNLPLAAVIVGAPYIGGALFLADRILGDRVARFASVKYKVSGDWKQPTVEFDRAFDNKAALED